MVRHLQNLFSQAYDASLSPEEKRAFEAHLDGCAECSSAYAGYRSALGALTSLPAAQMPVPVRLPSVAPGSSRVARRSFTPGPLWVRIGALTATAAVAAAGLLFINIHPRPVTGTASISRALKSTDAGNGAAATASPQLGAASLAQCVPSSLYTAGGAQASATFGNQVVRTDPARPGQKLVLSTQSTTVSAGSTVLIYARFDSGSAQVVPCVNLQESVGTPGPLAPSSNDTQLSIISGAAPVSGSESSGGPSLQAVLVPASIPKGTTLYLVAMVPADFPQGGEAEMEAVLAIQVS